MSTPVYIIAAADEKNGIGIEGNLPWRLKDDMRFFKDITTKTKDPNKKNMVIMGRTTWESIPANHRPLDNRVNIVLTRNLEYQTEGAQKCSSIHDALDQADDSIEACFIIGGGSVYNQIINDPELTGIYLTRVKKHFSCDTFFPEIPQIFSKITSLGEVEEDDASYEYLLYERGEA